MKKKLQMENLELEKKQKIYLLTSLAVLYYANPVFLTVFILLSTTACLYLSSMELRHRSKSGFSQLSVNSWTKHVALETDYKARPTASRNPSVSVEK